PEVWFVHMGTGTCGNIEVDSVPIGGGTPHVEVPSQDGVDLGQLATTPSGSVIAVETQSCPPAREAPDYISVRVKGRHEARIHLPRDSYVFALTVSSTRLAFVLGTDRNKTLYVVPLHALPAGPSDLTVATAAKPLPHGCEWENLAWSDLGLLATQTCE